VQRALREFDRRLNSMLPARPRRRTEVPTGEVRPFGLSIVLEDDEPMVRVRASTLAGGSATDLGFASADSPPYLLPASAGVVQGGITIDANGGVTSRWIEIVAELSADTEDTFHVEIGTVAELDEGWRANNSRYGPIDVQICRDWFANPPRYGVTFIGSEA
jgi:hypothetical protein